MASPPPNPDTRGLPHGWIQQYNWEHRQWFYVNTHEQPPRSSWEHPLGSYQGYAPPPGPPQDRAYNSRPPYADRPYPNPPPQGYGGYSGYQPSYGQGYYNHAPPGGYMGGPVYGAHGHSHRRSHSPENRGYHHQPERVVYVEEERKHKKGPGLGTALLAGGAGLAGGALLMNAFEEHNEREREEGFEEGYADGWGDNQADNWGSDW